MPFKKKYVRVASKKQIRKLRKKMRKNTLVTRANATRFPGFPPTTRARMRYVTTFDIANGYPQQLYKFRANGCYDPDITSTGHQPIGWDQWTQFYNHYVVVGSKITTWITAGNDNNNSDGVCVFSHLDDDSVIPSDLSTLLEQGKVKYKICPGNMQTQRAIKLTQFYSPTKYFNIDSIKDNLPRLGASVAADPTEQAAFVIGIQGVMPSGTYGGRLQVLVQIDYIVEFSEPKDLAAS